MVHRWSPGRPGRDDTETEPPAAEPIRTGRILLAEDHPVNRMLVERILRNAGHEVLTAENGQEAVDAVKAGHYDLVLMDVQMPVMDGLAATRTIRESEGNGRSLPILALTAHAFEEDQRRCLDAGMDDYITKPVRPEALLEAVARWIRIDAGEGAESSNSPAADCIGDLDESFLDLLTAGDLGIERELEQLFRTDSLERIDALRSAIETRSPEEMAAQAHRLRGALGSIGAARISELSAQIESLGETGEMDGAEELLQQVEECMVVTHELLATRIRRLSD